MSARVVGKEYRQLNFNISPFNKNEERLNLLDRILWSMKNIRTSKLEGFKTYRGVRLDVDFSISTPSGKDWVCLSLFLVKDEEAVNGLEFNELKFAKWVCSGLR